MSQGYKYRTGIGQDSHRFLPPESSKPCIIGGVIFENVPGFAADSDGDIILHAICNAISSITGVSILGGIAIELCKKDGITDSSVYLKEAMKTLKDKRLSHIALSIEGKRPKMQSKIDLIRKNIAHLVKLNISDIGITVTSGDGLTDFGCGDGMQCFCIVTTEENQ
jgi:2-C-methyl-D-erythritol 2,4-cyclodiphosphate synthase